MSGSHAEIDVLDGQVVLRDLGSRNGTRLNGQPIRSAAVGPGDRITVGATVIVVR